MVDMSQSKEVLEQDCYLDDLSLTNSAFIPPPLHKGHSFPIRLRHFSGVDFGFATKSCKQLTSNF